jgi:hypothetical protein
MTEANMTGADMMGADMTGVDMTGADTMGADMTGADMTGADSDMMATGNSSGCGGCGGGFGVDEELVRLLTGDGDASGSGGGGGGGGWGTVVDSDGAGWVVAEGGEFAGGRGAVEEGIGEERVWGY